MGILFPVASLKKGKNMTLSEKKIGFIGSGNMGEALISGLITSGIARAENIMCSDIAEDRLKTLNQKYRVKTDTNNTKIAKQADILIYATKPQTLGKVLKETAPVLDMSKLIISIAAGVPLIAISSIIQKDIRLIRVMPNICAFVKESATAITAGEYATQEDIELAKSIFDSVGKTVFIRDSSLMDACTGLSGSGPAYVFIMIDALADAGVKMGLSRNDALVLSAQTILGSAKMVLESHEHPGQLKDRVTSPGGTTIMGIHSLEQGNFRNTLINAVEAATLRARELGTSFI
jgi:pyrroline-5-carboxylate reductase